MDQQRLESYFKLINQFLEHPNDCFKILSSNVSLINKEFVAVLTQRIKILNEENEHDAAIFLKSIAYQIFLSQLFQAAYSSNVSSQFIYPLLEENLDKLDNYFAQIFEGWVLQTLSSLEGKDALRIAALIHDLCIKLAEFPKGNQANSLEISVKGCEAVLMTAFARDKYFRGWALTQSTLGNFYGRRMLGNRADNLEKAIACHKNSLEVWKYEISPESWALSQNNLANTYGKRIKGERSENIEQAIRHCHNALRIRTYVFFQSTGQILK